MYGSFLVFGTFLLKVEIVQLAAGKTTRKTHKTNIIVMETRGVPPWNGRW